MVLCYGSPSKLICVPPGPKAFQIEEDTGLWSLGAKSYSLGSRQGHQGPLDSDLLSRNSFQTPSVIRGGVSSIFPNLILIGSVIKQSRATGEKSLILTLGRVGTRQGMIGHFNLLK